MTIQTNLRLTALFFLLSLLISTDALAGPYGAVGPTVTPAPKYGLPTPAQVPSKEYSNRIDKGGDFPRTPAAGLPHAADPEQVIAWDGNGGTRDATIFHGNPAAASIDYSGTRVGDSEDREVDAIANKQDVLFNDVRTDNSYLLYSVGPSAPGKTGNDHIFYETPMPLTFPAGLGGPKPVADGGIWAAPATIESDTAELNDVDGLEVWGFGTEDVLENYNNLPGGGSDQYNDSNRYSLEGDPDNGAIGGGPRVSVWNGRLVAGTAAPYILQSAIATAVDTLALSGDLDAAEEELVDVDALMVLDQQGDESFGPLDQILFSIAPIPGEFDGGEIFHFMPGGPAAFLNHGDHLWDQAFDVAGTLAGFLGVDPEDVSENINAIEAVSFFLESPPPVVPEPGSFSISVLAVLGLLTLRYSARKRLL